MKKIESLDDMIARESAYVVTCSETMSGDALRVDEATMSDLAYCSRCQSGGEDCSMVCENCLLEKHKELTVKTGLASSELGSMLRYITTLRDKGELSSVGHDNLVFSIMHTQQYVFETEIIMAVFAANSKEQE